MKVAQSAAKIDDCLLVSSAFGAPKGRTGHRRHAKGRDDAVTGTTCVGKAVLWPPLCVEWIMGDARGPAKGRLSDMA